MWANYLPKSRIEGFDIRPECDQLCRDLANVTITICDPRETQRAGYDLFVDDGSHIAEDIVGTLVHCQNWLRSGGYYVIEDMSCTYNADYAAKLNKRFDANKPNDRNLILSLFDKISRMVDGKAGTFSEMYYFPQMRVLKKR